MATIVNTNSKVRAVPKSGFSAIAGHIIQQDGSSSLAKCSKGEGCCTCEENVYTYSTVSNSNAFKERAIKNFREDSDVQTTHTVYCIHSYLLERIQAVDRPH